MNLLISILIPIMVIFATLTGDVCPVYHFVITGVHEPATVPPLPEDPAPDGTVAAPLDIRVITEQGEYSFPLDRVTGKVAHYQGVAPGTIQLAKAYIHPLHNGNFNQSGCVPTAINLEAFAARSRYTGFGVAMAGVALCLALVMALAWRRHRR